MSQPASIVALSADTSTTEFAPHIVTGPDSNTVSVVIKSGSSLGSGTLSLTALPIGGTFADRITIEPTLAVGDKWKYEVGRYMEVRLELTGSSSPSVTALLGAG